MLPILLSIDFSEVAKTRLSWYTTILRSWDLSYLRDVSLDLIKSRFTTRSVVLTPRTAPRLISNWAIPRGIYFNMGPIPPALLRVYSTSSLIFYK